jgi:dipeptidyl-peptidase-4
VRPRKAWVAINDNPHWLKDGSFLWQSERNGWNHFYHYSADGKLLRQVTDGQWEVSDFEGIDADKGLLYFTGTRDSHIAPQLYSIKLDGTGLTRLTTSEGSHRIEMSPTQNYFVDSWSDINTPTQTRLFDASGKLVRAINENQVRSTEELQVGRNEFASGENQRWLPDGSHDDQAARFRSEKEISGQWCTRMVVHMRRRYEMPGEH